MALLDSDPYLGDFDQFLQSDPPVPINIIELVDGLDISLCDVMLRFHKLEVVDKLLESGGAITIAVVGGPEEAF